MTQLNQSANLWNRFQVSVRIVSPVIGKQKLTSEMLKNYSKSIERKQALGQRFPTGGSWTPRGPKQDIQGF